MNQLTFDDPGVQARSVKLRTQAKPVEKEAAVKAVGKAGSWRHRIFQLVKRNGDYGATSVEVAYALAAEKPCSECGCEHRPPIPVNQIASRLQELREWGYLTHKTLGGEIATRTMKGRTAEVHVVTFKGMLAS